MWEAGALVVSNQAEVLDHVLDRRRRSLNGFRCIGNMLHSLLSWLEEIAEVCSSEGVEIGILVGHSRSLSIRHVAFDRFTGRVRVRAATVDRRMR